MSICYIVGAGEFYGKIEPKSSDLVIAADGGADTLKRLGVRCDLLLGDMDSLREKANEKSFPTGCNTPSSKMDDATEVQSEERAPEAIVYPVEKDETDTHLAYLEGERRGYTDFRIYGGVGGREDHTFANYSLLLYAKNRGHRMILVGDGYEYFVIKNESVTLSGRTGSTLSVFAFGGAALGVDILGAKYEAKGATLSPEFPLGVSNSFVGKDITVSVKDGALLVMKAI